MGKRVLFRRLSLLGFVVALSLICYGGTALAGDSLLWYDGFVIDADDGAGPNYVAGNLAGQQGGSDAGSGIGFFDDAMGNPNPWLGVNNMDDTDTDSWVEAGSLTRNAQSPPSTGDRATGGEYVFGGCCQTSRSSRDFNTPLQNMEGTVYMGFLVNFGNGNPEDPHYRAVEFWNGKNTIPTIDDDMDPMTPEVPNPNFGRVGDGQLNMSIGFSSFGNYNGAENQGMDPDPNTQLSARVDGVFEEFGLSEERKYQFDEHLEFADQVNQTHSIVIKFDLSLDDREFGGVGDTISFFLDPKPTDTTEPTPSLVVAGVDLNLDAMSNIILFHFTGQPPNKPNGGSFDELRVGTTWGGVAILGVPEPATLSLLGLGVIGALLSARRKRA